MTIATTGRPVTLKRSLTLWNAVLYGLGVTIGAGIYVLIGPAAARAGMHAPLAFLGAALLMVPTAASFAELASRMPVAASEAAYVRAGFGSVWAGRVIGLLVIAIAIVSSAAISVGSAGYIRVFLDLPQSILIAAVVVAMGGVAMIGIKESVTFAGIMTLIEVGGLLIIVAAGFLVEPGTVTRLPEIWTGVASVPILVGLLSASLLAVFAFIGFEGIVNVAEEVERPQRNLPRAIFVTLALTTILYCLVAWVARVAVGAKDLGGTDAPLALAFSRLTGWSPLTMSAIAIIATMNGIIVQMIMASRVIYGLSAEGGLPAALGAVNPRTRTPIRATAVTLVVVLLLALLLPLERLADITSRITLVMFAIINLALVAVKMRETEPPPGIFLAPLWVPIVGFALTLLFLLADLFVQR
jgi:basic amino acid/polyamine antiporter, APA family